MTTTQLELRIEKVKKQIRKGNAKGFKSGQESDLHQDLQQLRECLNQLERLNHNLTLLKTF